MNHDESRARRRVVRPLLAITGLAVLGGLAVLPNAAAENATRDMENVAYCVVNEAQKLRAGKDPLAARYPMADRVKLQETCKNAHTTPAVKKNIKIDVYSENPISGSVGLNSMIDCGEPTAKEAAGDMILWSQRFLCVAHFEWIDDSLGYYYEFAVYRGKYNDPFWRVLWRRDSAASNSQAPHIPGSSAPGEGNAPPPAGGAAPPGPGTGTGPGDPGSGSPTP